MREEDAHEGRPSDPPSPIEDGPFVEDPQVLAAAVARRVVRGEGVPEVRVPGPDPRLPGRPRRGRLPRSRRPARARPAPPAWCCRSPWSWRLGWPAPGRSLTPRVTAAEAPSWRGCRTADNMRRQSASSPHFYFFSRATERRAPGAACASRRPRATVKAYSHGQTQEEGEAPRGTARAMVANTTCNHVGCSGRVGQKRRCASSPAGLQRRHQRRRRW